MSSVICEFKPYSRSGKWLMSVKRDNRPPQVICALRKIKAMHYRVCRGGAKDIIEFFEWYQTMDKLEKSMQESRDHVKQRIKERCQSEWQYQNMSDKIAYRLRISTPLSAKFYQLLVLFDQLMHAVDTAIIFGLFKRTYVLSKQHTRHQKQLLALMNRIGRYNFQQAVEISPDLTDEERALLSVALYNNILPILDQSLLTHLEKLAGVANSENKT